MREADVRAAAPVPRALSEAPLQNPLTPRRHAIAKRLRHSRDRTVPVTLTTTADVTNLVALRQQFKASEAGAVPAYSDLAAVLAARVLRRHPLLAVRWDDEQSTLRSIADTDFHIGIAVDTAAGLLVPVVRDILRKSLVAIATETRRLAEQARSGRLTGADIQTPVLTVSNLGSYGIDAFTPVINYPEISILGLGAVRREPVVGENDQILIRDRMVLSLTFDHAAIDGAPAAAFLADVAAAIANPAAHLLGDWPPVGKPTVGQGPYASSVDHVGGVKLVAVSPDGQNYAAVDHKDQLRILDARTLEPLVLLNRAQALREMNAVQFSLAGERIVGALGKRLIVWSAKRP